MACSTISAWRRAAGVSSASGVGPPSRASRVATRPDASASRSRSAWTAGALAAPGRHRPIASIMQAMVLAVPMTMQVPRVGASRPLTSSISAASSEPARCAAHSRRQSVQAPRVSPRHAPASIGPVGSTIAGRPALAAPISCAGSVLSQPPISTTLSIGCARIISSVSSAIRLRRNMLVGCAKLSCSEMVGKAIGRPPASSTPRRTASIRSGTVPWHGLKSLAVLAMPTIGRSSASSE